EKGAVDRWYRQRYGERRKPGRPVRCKDDEDTKERKPFDYPSPTALRNWLDRFRCFNERMEAFMPAYENCGNRRQLHPDVEAIVDRCVERYASRIEPARADIFDEVEVELKNLNERRAKERKPALAVSESTVHRRISAL